MYRQQFEGTPNNIKELLERYKNYLNGNNTQSLDEEDYEMIINYYDDAEDLKNALSVCETSTEALPYSAMLKIKKADLLIAVNRYNQALRVLNDAEILDNQDYNIILLRMDAYLGLNNLDKANETLLDAVDRFYGDNKTELLLEASEIFDDYDYYDGTFDCLKLTLQHDPNNEEALHKICFWADHCNRAAESLEIHQAIVEDYPYNELAWFNIGCSCQTLKLYEKAVDAYGYAVAINEEFVFAFRNMADAYIRLRKYELALDALQTVNNLAPSDNVILAAIAYCYEKLNDFDKARAYYKEAIVIDPTNTELLYKIGRTYMSQENFKSAVKYLNQSITFYSQKAEYYNALGQCYFCLNKNAEAIEKLTEAVKLKPKWKQGWKDLLTVYFEYGEFEYLIQLVDLAQNYISKREISFEFLKMAALYLNGNIKESIAMLEVILPNNVKHFNKIKKLCPNLLQNETILKLVSQQVQFQRARRKTDKEEDDNPTCPF